MRIKSSENGQKNRRIKQQHPRIILKKHQNLKQNLKRIIIEWSLNPKVKWNLKWK